MIIAILEFINPKLGFVYMISSIIFLIVYLVIVREDLHASMIREKISYETAPVDKLTGLLNRRAYAEDTVQFANTYPKDFIYMSLDVNGLKKVNDTIGHEAGDEIIVGAAKCMKKCFGAYGKVYRTGGDEFTIIIFVPPEKFNSVIEDFENEIKNWHGKLVDSLSISFGYVKASEVQCVSIHNVSVLADKRLYSSKAAFYKQKGMDRRGQFEAHVALCNLYTKILKVNLTNDTYQIVNMDTD